MALDRDGRIPLEVEVSFAKEGGHGVWVDSYKVYRFFKRVFKRDYPCFAPLSSWKWCPMLDPSPGTSNQSTTRCLIRPEDNTGLNHLYKHGWSTSYGIRVLTSACLRFSSVTEPPVYEFMNGLSTLQKLIIDGTTMRSWAKQLKSILALRVVKELTTKNTLIRMKNWTKIPGTVRSAAC
ncbi:hypothetical protein M427DRAFT_281328 [Gonapodya prolifera JEL478]|uniref:Uncharacterized protein n=1 Tax=Gonapodya prolifera (strain JEL478) TaxID=1344416 RepID=A0A139AYV5_GONPJ|nr:hypothetical protein M427DRAFT_281328 [Gonapodya prolifera JEL478]|eukprot:KXS21897.1 hypothetical protein M427DRAFT_281328 [Gonapodya prolifera JEL478]